MTRSFAGIDVAPARTVEGWCARRATAQRHRLFDRTGPDPLVRGARALGRHPSCRHGRSNFASGPARTTIAADPRRCTRRRRPGQRAAADPLPGGARRDGRRADALLVLQASNCNEQIPAKLYEYLRTGRPILCTDRSGWRHRRRDAAVRACRTSCPSIRRTPLPRHCLRSSHAFAAGPPMRRRGSLRRGARGASGRGRWPSCSMP